MKKQAFRILTMLSLLLAVTAVSVSAQSKRSTINIPFSFNVGTKTLPAGDYTVEPIRQDSHNVWLVESKNGSDSVLFTTTPVWTSEPQEGAKLVFNRYDDQYFLSQIWSPGDNSGRELRMPKLERTWAKNGIRAEKVVIVPGAGD
jgi:hypothetical protein